MVAGELGRDLRHARPVHRGAVGDRPGGRRRGRRPRGARRPRGLRRGPWGADDARASAGGCCCGSPTVLERDAPRARRRSRRATTASCCARWRGQLARAAGVVPLLRRARRQDPGRHDPRRPAELPRSTRAASRVGVVGAIIAVELAAPAADLEARAGARGRLHVRRRSPPSTTPVSTLELAALFEEAGLPAGRLQRRHRRRRAGAALVAHPGVDKVAFTGSTATGSRSRRRRRATSRASRSSSAASRRTSSSTTPTSRRPPTASSPASSPPAARPAWRARGCSSTRPSTTSWSSGWRQRAADDPRSATRWRRRPRWARSRTQAQLARPSPASSAPRWGQRRHVVCGGGPDPEQGGLFVQPTVLTGTTPDMAS